MMNAFVDKLKYLSLIVMGFFTLMLVVFSVIYSPEYVLRALRWLDADVYDYKKFPERIMDASPAPFYFDQALDEELVRGLFETHPKVDDLETLLIESNTQAFIVIQDDAILYEHYFTGAERDSIVTSFSVAKSFVSALIGIAIEEGYISDVEDPITDYIPELIESDPKFGNISIHNLLSMSSGIKYVETGFLNGHDSLTYYFPDLRALALERTEVIDPPGEHFLYNNFHPLLLGMILERATGRSVTEYLEDKIWGPVRMEFAGSWSLDENGFEKMESGINARAIDFAKFGRLYLNAGKWNDNQVVPEPWVNASVGELGPFQDPAYRSTDFGPDLYATAEGGYYGYLWYGFVREGGQNDFFGEGNHGQFIYVSPQANLIIVRNGERYGEGFHGFQWAEVFYHFATEILK